MPSVLRTARIIDAKAGVVFPTIKSKAMKQPVGEWKAYTQGDTVSSGQYLVAVKITTINEGVTQSTIVYELRHVIEGDKFIEFHPGQQVIAYARINGVPDVVLNIIFS